MPESWVFIGIFLLIATAMGVLLLLLGSLLRPSRPSVSKSEPYESGVTKLVGDARARYTARFYIVAMLFVLFDIEVIFIYPWAVALLPLGAYGLIGMVIFILLLLVGYVHAWRKGAFEWV